MHFEYTHEIKKNTQNGDSIRHNENYTSFIILNVLFTHSTIERPQQDPPIQQEMCENLIIGIIFRALDSCTTIFNGSLFSLLIECDLFSSIFFFSPLHTKTKKNQKYVVENNSKWYFR